MGLQKIFLYSTLALTPLGVFAASDTITDLEDSILDVLGSIIPILIGVAVAFFFWGVIQFIRAGDDPAAVEKAKGMLVYGIIAIVVMVSIWGIITLLGNLLDIDGEDESRVDDFSDFIVEPPY